MLPLAGIPLLVAAWLKSYRDIFCRAAGFEHVSRYLAGLLLSPNKTVQGIYAQQVWPEEQPVSRRAMHAAVFEAGWDSDALMGRHRAVIAGTHRGRGLEVIALDWTYGHHERGPALYAVKRAYEQVEGRLSRYQTVVTAVVAHTEYLDGVAVEVQCPNYQTEELAYLQMTAQENYLNLESVRQRVLELLHYHKNRLAYRQRTEMVVEIVRQLEAEGQFPQAHDAFDNGVLSLPLTRLLETHGKHWVSALESSRGIQWQGQWRRVDEVAAELRTQHPSSFRRLQVTGRNGDEKTFWVFTKTVRLKRYGRKRLVIIHEQAELTDSPRFLLTDALHWDGARIIRVWSYRWPVEIFHEVCKPVVGLEAAQVRKEEAVQRHFRLSCVAQSLLQRTPSAGRKSERLAFAAHQQQTVGQKRYTLHRDALGQLLRLVHGLFAPGHPCEQVLERLMPA
jgi:hypothetical protein